MPEHRRSTFPLGAFFLVAIAILGNGCSVLVGNVKPVYEKSDDYRFLDLSKAEPEWQKLNPAETLANESPDGKTEDKSEASDVVFQSTRTASVISLNSACRPALENSQRTLRDFTNSLLMGITDINFRNERNLLVQDVPALETTVRGRINGQRMVLKTVVVKEHECLYDLMYVARPENFPNQEPTFDRFVSSVRIKR